MTICVATLFLWNYATIEEPDWGVAVMTASDQMITAGDIQYEPSQQKVASITPSILLLIAGDYSVHSEAIQATTTQIRRDQNATPQRVSMIYGQEIQRIKRREAEDILLSPFGLNTDSFLAQQKDMSDSFVDGLKTQLQNYTGKDVEALVVGSDKGGSHIYYIDSNGSIHCMDDVSFHAIGIGAWHAKSQLMQSGYTRHRGYADALAQTYSAKRRAEIAPGVGARTDIHVILRDSEFKLSDIAVNKLAQLYTQYNASQQKIAANSIKKLQEFLNDGGPPKNAPSKNDQENHSNSGKNASPAAQELENAKETPKSVDRSDLRSPST